MTNILAKLFLAADLVAYIMFVLERAKGHSIPDYSQDAIILGVMGLLAHWAFKRP